MDAECNTEDFMRNYVDKKQYEKEIRAKIMAEIRSQITKEVKLEVDKQVSDIRRQLNAQIHDTVKR